MMSNEKLFKDSDEIKCMPPRWYKLVRSSPLVYTKSKTVMTWKDGERQTVDEWDVQF